MKKRSVTRNDLAMISHGHREHQLKIIMHP